MFQFALAGLSDSANAVVFYDKGGIQARLAYNWRDKFLSGVANIVNVGTLPIYTRGYGWLDASWRHRVSKSMSFAIEGTNLLRTMRSSHFGVETHPQGNWLNDRQLAFVVTFEL